MIIGLLGFFRGCGTQGSCSFVAQPWAIVRIPFGENLVRCELGIWGLDAFSGYWLLVIGYWSVVSGQWSVVSGQWSVGCGLWAVGCGLWPLGALVESV